jgi:septal ring factor EnvC (AmiA/AmiB activator)
MYVLNVNITLTVGLCQTKSARAVSHVRMGLVMCSPFIYSQSDIKKATASLESQIEQLKWKLDNMRQLAEDRQAENARLSAKVKELEQAIQPFAEAAIDTLDWALNTNGTYIECHIDPEGLKRLAKFKAVKNETE